ncbi:L-threonine 3-dehydrogenase [Paenibacillus sp. J2TS4]|uniref:L-threonine 3-dehydrogenase n=1 Tax=Paenibacillus sp. J2TS4 TaxID=2807194 RepID=UPI001B290185|nr:L-threonine 3-dehydrogenase [Paenibacillus sp. J2TS4]GIP32193.1 L-threonine 3-dehydrogenase [Paenibacillus sp. J2TS4]
MSRMMEALVKEHRGFGAVYKQVPIPDYGPDEVLVRVKASSICGTDVHIYKWDTWAESTVVTPNVFGHEFAGVVEAVGDRVLNVKVGDHVSVEGHFVCRTCKACRTGNAHVCLNTRSFGITIPGCFAQYAVIRADQVIHNRPDVPFELACLQDPLGNAVQAVLAGDIVGKSVAVIGVGPIGLLAVMVAKACGAGQVFAIDVNDYRLALAARLGADMTINSRDGSLVQTILQHTNHEGAEVILEMSGHPAAIREGFEAAAPAGRVALLGIPSKEVSFDVARHIIFKGLHIDGITGRRMYSTWYQMKGLLDNHRMELSQLVTHRFPLEQFEEAFSLMMSGQCGKVVFIHE